MPLYDLKKQLAERLAVEIQQPEWTAELLLSEFGAPPNAQLGHIAFPCFKLAKAFREPGDKIAKRLATQLSGSNGLQASATGPYVNFKFDFAPLFRETFTRLVGQGALYGRDSSGVGQKILLEYCSPNIAKKLGFQHIRSTLLGSVLSNCYAALGYEVRRVNFVGDWGTQFSGLLAAIALWGDPNALGTDRLDASMAILIELYIRFNDAIAKDPKQRELAAEWLKRLEAGDPAAKELWTRIREISLAAMGKTLTRMGLSFDWTVGESHYIPRMAAVLEEVKSKAEARLSEGAWIVDVPGIEIPALVQKRDGTTLYLTRDIAAAKDRFDTHGFNKSIYIVSDQQKLHFQLLFGVLKKMGFEWADRCVHLTFGTIFLNSETMSTRKGTMILLDDILNEAHRLALEECTQKNPELANKEEVAEQVGLAALVFGNLSAHRQREIHFDWKHVLSFEGETGPYVQYSLVRCYSLLKKAEEKGENVAAGPLAVDGYVSAPEEEALLLELSRFRSVLRSVVIDDEPYQLTHYLIDVAKQFNRFYYKLPVLQSLEAESRAVRLQLVRGTRQVLENGLRLLGVATPNEM